MQLWNTIEAQFEFERKIVGDAQVVIEVGAKDGDFTQKYLEIFPNAHIYTFEPLSFLYQKLRNIALAKNRVTLSSLALLDIIGHVDFNIIQRTGSTSLGSSSILPPSGIWDIASIESSIKVDTTTLDVFCEDKSISHIDLLSIDTNGVDLQVLKGAATLLSARVINAIRVELIFWPYFEGQCNHGEIIKFLAKYGMHLIAIFPNYWKGEMRYADAIFVREETKDG